MPVLRTLHLPPRPVLLTLAVRFPPNPSLAPRPKYTQVTDVLAALLTRDGAEQQGKPRRHGRHGGEGPRGRLPDGVGGGGTGAGNVGDNG